MLYQGNNLSISRIDHQCAELRFDVADSSVNIFNTQTVQN